MTPEPHQHPDFRLPAARAVRHLLSAVLNHLVVVICYGSPRKLTQNPIPFPPEPYCCSWEVCCLCYRTFSFPDWKWAMCSMIRSLGSVFYPVYISSLNHSYLIFPLPHHLILPFYNSGQTHPAALVCDPWVNYQAVSPLSAGFIFRHREH